MGKNNINDNLSIRHSIEQWSVRVIRAGKKRYELAKEAEITEGHLSLIMNLKVKNPQTKTLNKIERVLKSWGV